MIYTVKKKELITAEGLGPQFSIEEINADAVIEHNLMIVLLNVDTEEIHKFEKLFLEEITNEKGVLIWKSGQD